MADVCYVIVRILHKIKIGIILTKLHHALVFTVWYLSVTFYMQFLVLTKYIHLYSRLLHVKIKIYISTIRIAIRFFKKTIYCNTVFCHIVTPLIYTVIFFSHFCETATAFHIVKFYPVKVQNLQ